MAKRDTGKFDRIPNDLYRTFDPRAMRALAPHLMPGTLFCEPCGGHGDLIDQLVNAGHQMAAAFDIDPRRADIRKGDATTIRWRTSRGYFITNPPWTRDLLHRIIRNLASQAPTWLLFDADWAFTDQSAQFAPLMRKVVAVGRLRWIPNTDMDGRENSAWYLFDGTRPPAPTEFIGRQ